MSVPIEEWLLAFTVEPTAVVKVQVVAIPMSRVNLANQKLVKI